MAKARGMRKAARRSAARARPRPQKSARSRRKVSRTRAATAQTSKRRPRRQRFVASHLEPGAFKGGLRAYAQYRDLSIAEATDGLVVAHVINMVPP